MKGTGKMGEHRYRKSKGGYPHARVGGPLDIAAHNRDAREAAKRLIREIKQDGKRVFRDYIGGQTSNWEVLESGHYVDRNATLVEVWEVDGYAWVIVPARHTCMLWQRLVRRLGLNDKRFDPTAKPELSVPPELRGREWSSLNIREKERVWHWRFAQGIADYSRAR